MSEEKGVQEKTHESFSIADHENFWQKIVEKVEELTGSEVSYALLKAGDIYYSIDVEKNLVEELHRLEAGFDEEDRVYINKYKEQAH
jgi:hypothetical protein